MIATDTAARVGTTRPLPDPRFVDRSPAASSPAASSPAPAPLHGAPEVPRAPRGTSRSAVLRRRIVALVALVLLVTLATVAVGRVGAEAELADRVAGHEVLAPGDTLWDVAVRSAPDGVDPRDQLIAIRELNGIGGASVEAWTVVLLPAR